MGWSRTQDIKMINIDAIKKDNITSKPFEYMLIDFVDADFVRSSYKDYKENFEIQTQFDEFSIVNPHPVQELLEDYEEQIVSKVNDVWDLDIVSCSMSTSMFDKNSELDTHNDYNYDGNFFIPARGIIYLNDEKEFGTNIYETERGEPTEIGGSPGQLFLFKVSKNSWHSAGKDIKSDFRITCNWLLNREGSPHQ
jgi:hypothetical protein